MKRGWIWSATTLAAWVAGSQHQVVHADALSEESVEFQIGAAELTKLMTETAGAQELCFASFPCTGGEEKCVVDHLTFEPSSLRRSPTWQLVTPDSSLSVGVRPVQLVQPVTAFVKLESCVTDASCPRDQYATVQTVSAVFDLAIQGSNLCAKYKVTEPAVGGKLGEEIKKALGPDRCLPAGPEAMKALVGDAPQTGKGLSLSDDYTRVAIRYQYGKRAMERFDEWVAFLVDNQIGPTPQGSKWSLLVGQSFLRKAAIDGLLNAVNKPDDPMSLDPDDEQSTEWDPGWVRTTARLGAEIDVPMCINSIGANPITAKTVYRLTASGQIEVLGHVDWDLVDSDVLLCSVVDGAAIAAAAAYAVLGAVLGPLTATISWVIAGLYEPPGGQGQASCEMIDEHRFRCSKPLKLPPLAFGNGPAGVLTADALTGAQEGMLLSGSLTVPTAKIDPLSASMTPIVYDVHGGCNSLRLGYEGRLYVEGDARLCTPPTVVRDPYGVYSLRDVSNRRGELPGVYEVAMTEPVSYPPQITFRTSRGSFTYRGDIPEVFTGSVRDKRTELAKEAIDCKAAGTGWLGMAGRFDPHWHVDPPVDWVFGLTSSNRLVNAAKTVKLRSLSIDLSPLEDVEGELAGAFELYDQEVLVTAEVLVPALKAGAPPSVQVVQVWARTDFRGQANANDGTVSLALWSGLRIEGTKASETTLAEKAKTLTLPGQALTLRGLLPPSPPPAPSAPPAPPPKRTCTILGQEPCGPRGQCVRVDLCE